MDQLFDFIKDYGGYAGAASVLGLAVLSLLYFAQAREVKRLREWAGRAPERDAELQARVAAEAARRTPAAPAVQRQPQAPARQPGAPQTAAAQAAARPGAPNGGQPGAVPAGAGAAGAAAAGAAGAAAGAGAAQGQQPTTAQPAAGGTPGQPAQPGTTPAQGGAAPGQPAAAPGQGAPPAQAGDGAPASPPAAATASGAAAPPATTPPTTPGPNAPAAGATPTGDAPTGDAPPPVAPRTAAARPRQTTPPPRAAALRSTGTGARASRPATVQTQRTGRRIPAVAIAIAAGVVVLGVVLALVLGGGDGEQNASRDTQPANTVLPPGGETQPAQTNASEQARPKSETTVAVLNGTTITGLAARTAERVKGDGYNLGTVADAPVQNRSATLVQYAEGARAEALAVAKVIGVGQDAVSRLDVNTRTVAGDNARVVVTVGADQNQQSGQG